MLQSLRVLWGSRWTSITFSQWVCRKMWLNEFHFIESWMVRHLFSYYRESGTKTWGPVLSVKLSGRWRGNKEDLFGLEKLKVEESNSHGHGSVYVELSGFQSTDTYCCPLFISCDNPGKEAQKLASRFSRWGQQASESLNDLGKGLQYIGSWGWLTPNSTLFSTHGVFLGASCVPLCAGWLLTGLVWSSQQAYA